MPGTLIISPQAKVRSSITAANVIINGDYEGDVDCGGRFEIGSTGRVKGKVKAQVLVVKEGAHFEGGVIMTPEAASSTRRHHRPPARQQGGGARRAAAPAPARRPAREASSTRSARRSPHPTGPGTGSSGP